MNITQASSPLSEMLKEESIQSVVHDLRGPMTVIKGNLLILLSGMVGHMPEEQLQLIRRSVGPLEELILMTDNMLQATKLEGHAFNLERAPTDLDRLLTDIVEFYQVPFKEREMQIFRAGNTLGITMLIDGLWIKRVLHNLVWNAFKYTPDKGCVTLNVEHTKRGLQIVVKDTGRGIPADHLAKLFDKFSQVDSLRDRADGAGLGLWICKRIMELHGGRIAVESTQGDGSRFVLYFPTTALLS